jgi:hypothetical protein
LRRKAHLPYGSVFFSASRGEYQRNRVHSFCVPPSMPFTCASPSGKTDENAASSLLESHEALHAEGGEHEAVDGLARAFRGVAGLLRERLARRRARAQLVQVEVRRVLDVPPE